jgi:hypothetical protein
LEKQTRIKMSEMQTKETILNSDIG